MAKDSFIFYRSFYEAIKELPSEEQVKVYQAVCEYSLNGELPELTGIPRAIFTLIKPQIEANNIKYENGKKGGRPKTETEEKPKDNLNKTEREPKNKQTETEPEPNVNVECRMNNDNVNDLLELEEEQQKKLDFKIFGKYENVHLSESQYQKLLTKIMDKKSLTEIIDSFSENLAAKKPGKLEPEFDGQQNHFVRLEAYWEYRRKNPEKFIKDFKKTSKTLKEIQADGYNI